MSQDKHTERVNHDRKATTASDTWGEVAERISADNAPSRTAVSEENSTRNNDSDYTDTDQ